MCEAALSARTFSGDGAVVLDVRDAFMPENAGRYRVAADGVERTDAEAEIALDISALGSVYLGGFTFRRARRVVPRGGAGGRRRRARRCALCDLDRALVRRDLSSRPRRPSGKSFGRMTQIARANDHQASTVVSGWSTQEARMAVKTGHGDRRRRAGRPLAERVPHIARSSRMSCSSAAASASAGAPSAGIRCTC